MQIIYEDQTTLVAKDKAWDGIAMGLLFVLVGFGIYFFLSESVALTQKSKGNPPAWFPFVFAGVGIVQILVSVFTTVRLDKTTRQGTITKQRIIGRRAESFPLDQVKEIRYENTVDFFRKGRRRMSSRVAFVLTDGRHPDFRVPQRGFRGREIGARIAHFLGVPFTDISPPTAGEALRMLSDTMKEAIANKKQSQDNKGGSPPPLVK